jgi:excinuclease UvrABC nuclease subunit
MQETKVHKWKTAPYHAKVADALPSSSGIYVLAVTRRVDGFPVSVQPLYVGKSMNLRRRTIEHQHPLEPNPGLNGLGEEAVEIWWQSVKPEELAQREAQLIRSLQPSANRQGKSKKKEIH